MAKFDKKPASGSYNSDREAGKGAGSKKSDYKSKRSFSKNKTFREQKPGGQGGNRTFNRDEKPFRKRPGGPGRERNTFDKEERSFDKKFNDRDKKFSKRSSESREGFAPKKKFHESGNRFEKTPGPRNPEKEKTSRRHTDHERDFSKDKKSGNRKHERGEGFKPNKKFGESKGRSGQSEKPRNFEEEKSFRRHDHHDKPFTKHKKRSDGKAKTQATGASDDLVRLNKYLSNAGIASRREADVLIQSGAVKVNGEVVDQLGYKIKPGDKVTYGDQAVKSEKKVYLLLNKPKDYITTMDDPRERKTVMELIKGACRERVYPVGRLDRNTTGVLLFTNDGDITKKLTHPKFGIKKVYQVTLSKSLRAEDFTSLTEGIELEDGPIKADDLAFVGEGRKEVGVEIHSGRNRIVRRMFEHLGYEVIKLDRVVFAGLTKKDLPRGKWRFLNPKEVNFLHMLG